MGTYCSINTEGDADQDEKSINDSSRKPSPMLRIRQLIDQMAAKFLDSDSESTQYPPKRERRAQAIIGLQHAMKKRASPEEQAANETILKKRQDDDRLYRESPDLIGLDGKARRPFAHDHFSRNVQTIEKTELLKAARFMPKGSHLHLHFNSTLLPGFLLGVAKGMENMYISSPTHKLQSKDDFDSCEIVFTLQNFSPLSRGDMNSQDARGPNIFHDDYEPRQLMRYQYFRTMWNHERNVRKDLASHTGKQAALGDSGLWDMDMECDDWLNSKLIFSQEHIDSIFDPANYSPNQTRKPETKEEEQARQKQAEEVRWPKDIELAFQASPHKHVRERATRYLVLRVRRFNVTNRLIGRGRSLTAAQG